MPAELICLHCKKTFYVDPYRKNAAKFCSVFCHDEYRRKYLKCDYCGKEFKRPRSNVRGDYKHSFCSSKCFHDWTKVSEEYKKQKSVERVRNYRKNHQGWYRSIKAKRRAMEKNFDGSFTDEEWELLKQKYDYKCLMCGRGEPEIKLTVDHVVPLAVWEEWKKENNNINYNWNDIENIQPLCQSCNSKKLKNIIDLRKKI